MQLLLIIGKAVNFKIGFLVFYTHLLGCPAGWLIQMSIQGKAAYDVSTPHTHSGNDIYLDMQ